MSNYKFKGYRIDGVAACRLAWQWFNKSKNPYPCSEFPTQYDWNAIMPRKESYIDREVIEPLAVRLAGEYDVHDSRMKTEPDIELFQHGLRSRELGPDTWDILLSGPTEPENGKRGLAELYVETLLDAGQALQFARANEYRDVITQQGFDVTFCGITFLACNSHECDIRSQLFAAGIKPHHQALLGFTFTGSDWRVSMYRIDGIETDILAIAKKFNGGGHPGACGFHTPYPIWMEPFRHDGKITPQTTDAVVWARDWADTIRKYPNVPADEGAMISWFASAIMAGYDLKSRQCAAKS